MYPQLFLDGYQTEPPPPLAAPHPCHQKQPEEKGKIQPLHRLFASLHVKQRGLTDFSLSEVSGYLRAALDPA